MIGSDWGSNNQIFLEISLMIVDLILLISLFCAFFFLKLHEELYKAKYVLTDGDVASLLPSKTHGSFLVFSRFIECLNA